MASPANIAPLLGPLFVLAFAVHAAPAGIGVYFVGSDAACPFHTIQDAIDAAAAHPGPDFVWLAMNEPFTGEHVRITDTDRVVIEGGFVDCTDNDIDTALTTVSGAGNDGGAVFEVNGSISSDIYFKNVFITGANRNGEATGGGIEYYGSGKLTLEQSSVSINSAGYGGGINVLGQGHVVVTLMHDVLIVNNTAQTSGGGIRIDGETRLFVLQPQTWIALNQAIDGDGGGLEVIGPAHAEIGSPGYNGSAVIGSNTARYGGGIDIVNAHDRGASVVRIFTTDPQHPVQIADNFAYATGGAIYLKPWATVDDPYRLNVLLCAYDFRIEGNSAQEGAAIYEDTDYDVLGDANGSHVRINSGTSECLDPEPPAALGAVPCAPGLPCNRFENNSAQLSDGTPTGGSTILIQNGGEFHADRFEARGNRGGHFLRGVGGDTVEFSDPTIDLSNCLIVDNTVTQELLAAENENEMRLQVNACTIAGNTIGAPFVVHSPGASTEFFRSIVDQPGRATTDPPIADPAKAQYVLTNDRTTLPETIYIEQGEPAFADPANGDYHLQRTSAGVDFAPGATDGDLDGLPRMVDLIDVPDRWGAMDLGAYELQTQVAACAIADTIYCNGFDAQ